MFVFKNVGSSLRMGMISPKLVAGGKNTLNLLNYVLTFRLCSSDKISRGN